ncbi:MAG: HAD family hydrolase [Pseudomonadota bacterium]
MTIKAILFDKDGTLFHYAATWGAWARSTLMHLTDGDADLARRMGWEVGYRWDSDDFVSGSPIVHGEAEEINRIWQASLPGLSVEEINRVALHYIHNTAAAPVGDLNAILGGLVDAGFVLGVATNDFEEGAHKQLGDHGASGHFAFIAGYDSGYGAKPEPGQILGFADHVGIDAMAVAMVGDSTHDLHAAARANVGLKVGVLTGPAVEADIADAADVVLPDISHLERYLAQLA